MLGILGSQVALQCQKSRLVPLRDLCGRVSRHTPSQTAYIYLLLQLLYKCLQLLALGIKVGGVLTERRL